MFVYFPTMNVKIPGLLGLIQHTYMKIACGELIPESWYEKVNNFFWTWTVEEDVP